MHTNNFRVNKKSGRVFFYILIRGWKCYENFDQCIDSVLNQTYTNFKIIFVDDNSNYTKKQKQHIANKLEGHIVVFNSARKYAIYNQYHLIHKFADNDDAVIVNLDADDRLLNKNVLSYLGKIYTKYPKCNFTYGECLIEDENGVSKNVSGKLLEHANQKYPPDVVNKKAYRKFPFLPLHPRTFKVRMFKKIKKEDFKRSDGSWLRFAEDQSVFFPLLEMNIEGLLVIKKPLYIYNASNTKSDVKINTLALLRDELEIRRKNIYENIDI